MTQFNHIKVVLHDETGIFEVIFKNKSNDAVDEYAAEVLAQGLKLRKANKFNQPVYILIDVTNSGLYSLTYAITRIRENVVQLSDMPRAYFAYITDVKSERIIINQFQYMQNTREKDSREVFGSHERDEAIQWLLSKTEH